MDLFYVALNHEKPFHQHTINGHRREQENQQRDEKQNTEHCSECAKMSR